MHARYTAVIQQHGEWWIGWTAEVPGVNSQGSTRDELLDNLRDVLEEALEMNRADARDAATGGFEEVSISCETQELLAHLRRHGCVLFSEGRHHSWWGSPALNWRSAIPRNTELPDPLARKICRDLGAPDP